MVRGTSEQELDSVKEELVQMKIWKDKVNFKFSSIGRELEWRHDAKL